MSGLPDCAARASSQRKISPPSPLLCHCGVSSITARYKIIGSVVDLQDADTVPIDLDDLAWALFKAISEHPPLRLVIPTPGLRDVFPECGVVECKRPRKVGPFDASKRPPLADLTRMPVVPCVIHSGIVTRPQLRCNVAEAALLMSLLLAAQGRCSGTEARIRAVSRMQVRTAGSNRDRVRPLCGGAGMSPLPMRLWAYRGAHGSRANCCHSRLSGRGRSRFRWSMGVQPRLGSCGS